MTKLVHGFCLAAAAAALLHCGPPIRNTPIDDIPKIKSLDELMDNQATTADPQMRKAAQTSFGDDDWPAFAQASKRIQATSLKIPEFSKGPEFDHFAHELNVQAKALGDAAAAKDAAAASAALTGMKAACKQCHSKFK
jgi:hypothetical protein